MPNSQPGNDVSEEAEVHVDDDDEDDDVEIHDDLEDECKDISRNEIDFKESNVGMANEVSMSRDENGPREAVELGKWGFLLINGKLIAHINENVS